MTALCDPPHQISAPRIFSFSSDHPLLLIHYMVALHSDHTTSHKANSGMDGRQQSRSLRERADECVKKLQLLKERAERGRLSHHTSSTVQLLARIEGDINNNLRLLQAWIVEITGGKQTDDVQTVKTIESLFEYLYQSTDVALDSLNSRLRYRRLWLVGFIFHKRLDSSFVWSSSQHI